MSLNTPRGGFDPDGAADSDTLFGLPEHAQPAVRILPVPWDATASGRRGTAAAWSHVLEASWQVDLFDLETGDAWSEGIALDPPLDGVEERNVVAARAAASAREGGPVTPVNDASEALDHAVERWTTARLNQGVIPAILGGDHSVPLGAIRAARPDGILHIDAHADLRVAYEGFTGSHASIFHRVLEFHEGPLVQVGLRDLSAAEHRRTVDDPRIHAYTDIALGDALASGSTWASLVAEMVAQLPERVWVSVDIDGLDPALCPDTGTPVPGGLTWRQFLVLLGEVGRTRRIVGFDLCEVAPSAWDATVGARTLYKLSTRAIRSRG